MIPKRIKNSSGMWVWDDTDANWRDGLTVRVEVNPTATASVSYPAATSGCDGPQVASQAPPGQGAQLPSTGSGTGVVALLGLLMLVLIGFVLLPIYGVFYLVCVIIGTVKASQGGFFRYPLTFRVIS